jgi:hypothetical protein
MKMQRGSGSKKKTMRNRALEVSSNVLDGLPVSQRGEVHELGHSVDRKGHVGPCHCGILQKPNRAAVQMWIKEGLTMMLGERHCGIYRGTARFCTSHVASVKKIKDVFRWGEKETLR